MSIIRTLLKLIDPIEHNKQAAEEKRKREVQPPDVDPDQIELEVPPPRPDEPPRVCRICGHEGQGTFCPTCLAETMERRR